MSKFVNVLAMVESLGWKSIHTVYSFPSNGKSKDPLVIQYGFDAVEQAISNGQQFMLYEDEPMLCKYHTCMYSNGNSNGNGSDGYYDCGIGFFNAGILQGMIQSLWTKEVSIS